MQLQKRPRARFKKVGFLLLLTTGYFLLATVFTWPLAKQITTHGFGVDEDSPYHIWHNWWFKFSLLDLKQSPLLTDYIFHPQTIPLAFDANASVFSALTLPLYLLTDNVVLASNVIFLLSFALSGLGTYLLAKYILKPQKSAAHLAAILTGVIYAFSPYTFAQAIDGHINLTSTWFLPFYVLFLYRALKEKNWKLGVLAGIFLGLQFLNDLTYTAFTLLFTGLFFLQKILHEFLSETHLHTTILCSMVVSWIKTLGAVGITSLLIALPVLIPTLKLYRTTLRIESPLWVQNEWSADLLAFFRPNDHSTFFRGIAYTPPRGTVEGTVFLGYTATFLALIAFINWISKKRRSEKEGPGLWIFLAAAFFILSLGPALHIGGQWRWEIGNFTLMIPLPFILVHKIPLIGGTQEPTRMNPYVMLPMALLAAEGVLNLRKPLQKLAKKLQVPRPQRLSAALAGAASTKSQTLFSVLCFLFIVSTLIEFLPLPLPTTDLRVPAIYHEIAEDPGDFSVLTLPLGFNSGNIQLGPSPIGSLQFVQTVHQKPSFRATVARLPASAFDYYRDLPLIKYFLNPSNPPDEQDTNPELAQQVFKDQLHIKYVVIHHDKYKKFVIGESERLIEEVLQAEKIYEAKTPGETPITAYQLH